MNIAEAKDQIKYAVKAYLTRDEYGDYVIPLARQRPVLLIGAPGIGKTAIMEQVAGELGIGLVSYSMTHHTRQSALGLPFIAHKSFEGVEYDASEYTMSEIIASIYELMDTTGVREGILFLDEITCVSEHLLRPCCSSCSSKPSERIVFPTAGLSSRRVTHPNTTSPCASSTS